MLLQLLSKEGFCDEPESYVESLSVAVSKFLYDYGIWRKGFASSLVCCISYVFVMLVGCWLSVVGRLILSCICR